MNNKIEIFNNKEFGQVRTLIINNEPYFVAKDIAKILGYSKLDAMYRVVEKEDKKNINPQSVEFTGFPQFGGILESNPNIKIMTIINESGLYDAIFSSKLQSAKKFKKWVTSEVLPTIRKHGAYMTDDTIEKALTDPDFLIKLATQLKEERQARLKAEEEKKILEVKIEEDKPLVEFSKQVSESVNAIDIGDFAKLVKNEHIDIGRNRLFSWLRDNKYLMNNNVPYQNRISQGLFDVKEYTYTTPYGVQIGVKTKITGKGQIYLVEKLREQFCN